MNKLWFFNSNDIKSYKVDQGNIIYHSINGGLCIIDDDAFFFLKDFSKGKEIDDKILAGVDLSKKANLIREFIKRSFLCNNDSRVKSYDQRIFINSSVKIIQLIVSNDCNFNCTYCFENKTHVSVLDEKTNIFLTENFNATGSRKENIHHSTNRMMTIDNAILYVKKSIEFIKSDNKKFLFIQFFGGEPLVNWKTVSAILSYFKHGEEWGIYIHYSIVTNGSLINEQIAKKLSKYKVDVCVSFDSPLSTSRVFKNGNVANEKIITGIKTLVRYDNRIAINSTLSDCNWTYVNESLVEFVSNIGVKEIGIILELDPHFYEMYSSNKIINRLWTLMKAGRKYNVTITGYWHQISQLISNISSVPIRGFKLCSAKGCQFSIEPNGSIYACKGSSGRFGEISDGLENIIINNEFREYSKLNLINPKECSGCEIEHFCSGICLGSLEKKYNRIDTIEPNACKVYKGITKKIIKNLTRNEIPYLSMTNI